MSDSFYGGKQGYSFILSKQFNSESEMIAAFQNGPSYEDVQYGEYVMIHTGSPDPSNGRVYRRGYDYNNEMGGAILCGNIIGPSGYAPDAKFFAYDNLETAKNEMAATKGSDGTLYKGMSEGEIKVTTETGTKDSKITWKYYSFRTTSGAEATYLIGLKIPSVTFEFDAKQVASGNNPRVSINEDNPFYKTYNMEIPKGTSVIGATVDSEFNGDSNKARYLYLELSDYNNIDTTNDTRVINNTRYYRSGVVGNYISANVSNVVTPSYFDNTLKNAPGGTNKGTIVGVDYYQTTNQKYLGMQYYYSDGSTWSSAGGTTSYGSCFVSNNELTTNSTTYQQQPLNSMWFICTTKS